MSEQLSRHHVQCGRRRENESVPVPNFASDVWRVDEKTNLGGNIKHNIMRRTHARTHAPAHAKQVTSRNSNESRGADCAKGGLIKPLCASGRNSSAEHRCCRSTWPRHGTFIQSRQPFNSAIGTWAFAGPTTARPTDDDDDDDVQPESAGRRSQACFVLAAAGCTPLQCATTSPCSEFAAKWCPHGQPTIATPGQLPVRVFR